MNYISAKEAYILSLRDNELSKIMDDIRRLALNGQTSLNVNGLKYPEDTITALKQAGYKVYEYLDTSYYWNVSWHTL